MTVEVTQYTYNNGSIPVYTGGRLTLHYSTRRGRFNFMSPDEESLRCHVAIYESGKRLVSCNVGTDYEAEGTDADEAIAVVEEDIASKWIDTARGEKQRCVNFIRRYKAQIERGNAEHRLEQVIKKSEELAHEAARLAEFLSH